MNKLNFNVAILFLSVAGTYRVPLFCSRSDATFFPFFFERPHSLHVSSMKLESMTEIRKKLKKRSVYMWDNEQSRQPSDERMLQRREKIEYIWWRAFCSRNWVRDYILHVFPLFTVPIEVTNFYWGVFPSSVIAPLIVETLKNVAISGSTCNSSSEWIADSRCKLKYVTRVLHFQPYCQQALWQLYPLHKLSGWKRHYPKTSFETLQVFFVIHVFLFVYFKDTKLIVPIKRFHVVEICLHRSTSVWHLKPNSLRTGFATEKRGCGVGSHCGSTWKIYVLIIFVTRVPGDPGKKRCKVHVRLRVSYVQNRDRQSG